MAGERSSLARAGAWAGPLLLAATLVIALVVRVRLQEMPLERDEGEYAYAGQLILQGVPPYAEALNMKLPGVYYAYALIMAMFGETARGIHLGLAIWTTASAIVLYALALRLFGRWPAVAAACTFAVLSIAPGAFALAAHANHFALLPALLGCFVLTRPSTLPRGAILGAGVAFGVSFLMKQQALFLVLFGGLFTLWRLRSEGVKAILARCGLFAAGALAPYAALGVYLLSRGLFGRFWFWTVTYAGQYVSQIPLAAAWDSLMQDLPRVVGWNAGLWVLAVLGLIALGFRRIATDARVFLAGFTVCSALAVCPGFRFMPHYFILVFPAIGLLAGALLQACSGTTRLAASLAFVAMLSLSVAGERDIFFSFSVPHVTKVIYTMNPFAEAVEIGRYIKEHTSEGDRVAVLGSEPEIFFLSHRHAASRYIYVYALMEPQPYARRLQDEFVGEIESAAPAYVVLVRVPTSWLRTEQSETYVLDWAGPYLKAHYELAGLVDIFPDRPSEVYWDAAADGRRPESDVNVLVLRRKKA